MHFEIRWWRRENGNHFQYWLFSYRLTSPTTANIGRLGGSLGFQGFPFTFINATVIEPVVISNWMCRFCGRVAYMIVTVVCIVSVRLNGSRTVTGVLRGFDPFMNLVIDEAVEECKTGEKNNIGMVVCHNSVHFFHRLPHRVSST